MIKYFTFYEAIDSKDARENKIYNIPKSFDVINNILTTALCMEDVRKLLKNPVIVTSWYRSWTLNDFVKGSETSQHLEGKAVDFKCPKFGTPKEIFEAMIKLDSKEIPTHGRILAQWTDDGLVLKQLPDKDFYSAKRRALKEYGS